MIWKSEIFSGYNVVPWVDGRKNKLVETRRQLLEAPHLFSLSPIPSNSLISPRVDQMSFLFVPSQFFSAIIFPRRPNQLGAFLSPPPPSPSCIIWRLEEENIQRFHSVLLLPVSPQSNRICQYRTRNAFWAQGNFFPVERTGEGGKRWRRNVEDVMHFVGNGTAKAYTDHLEILASSPPHTGNINELINHQRFSFVLINCFQIVEANWYWGLHICIGRCFKLNIDIQGV